MINKNMQSDGRYFSIISSFFLLAFIAVSLWLIYEYAEQERKRDLTSWQSRLSLLVELRVESIEEFLEDKEKNLKNLASNASLRLFLSQYENKNNTNSVVLNAQRIHVNNLLRFSAVRLGFSTSALQYGKEESGYGVAVLDSDQQLIMSTKGFPKKIVRHKDTIKNVFKSAEAQLINFYQVSNKKVVFGYIVPVFKIQDIQSKTPVGAIILLLNPEESLYGLLKNKQSVTTSDETLLLMRNGPNLIYVSPLKNGMPLFHVLPDNNNSLASSFAFHNVGRFSEMKDYLGEYVLITGRKIANTSWRLVQKISTAEALSESNDHQVFLFTVFTLFVFMVAAAFVAVWKHGTSSRLKLLSQALETRTELLDAVLDNVKNNIVMVDGCSKVEFINSEFAHTFQVSEDSVKNKSLSRIIGDAADKTLTDASENDAPSVLSTVINNKEIVFYVLSSQLKSGEHKSATLYVLNDITELKEEQNKREKLGKGIISTLVKIVDLHDPHCENHSARTKDVAVAIATEMHLSEERTEALSMAALLANIGKLFVAKEVLTKMDGLTEDEHKMLKINAAYAVDLLSELSFNGPVVDIISQKNERLNGTGYPQGLLEGDILLEARILAVANSFVAMASSRAYRKGRAVDEVMNILLAQSGEEYDRQVVAALFHIAENKADWSTWQSINVNS